MVVVPYLFGGGTLALTIAIGLAVASMLLVGAGIGGLNGRSPLRSALRQVVAGSLAAAITYGVGALLGAAAG